MSQRDYDVIIVGTGLAGHCAALEALTAGARVLLVDAEPKVGGSSWYSTGILMGANTRYQRERGILDDHAERLYQNYLMSNQWLVQPSVAKRLCYEAGPTVDWLEGLGVEFLELTKSGGEDRPRGHVTGGGEAILAPIMGRVAQFDRVDTALKTRVDRLIMKDGVCTGIGVGDDVVTGGAVILAMGGMGANLDLLAQYHPAAFWEAAGAPRYVGPTCARGDVVRLAQQIDAQVMAGRGSRSPLWSFGGAYLPGWMTVVNALGRRFFDETTSYGIGEVLFAAQPGATGYGIFDDKVKREMQTQAEVVSHVKVVLPGVEQQYSAFTSGGVDDLVATGQIKKADTLEGLAAILGIPADNLLGTVERYNANVAAGSDDDYLKPAKSLRPISTGPFYGFDMHLPLFGLTSAGVRVDHNASVIHRTSRSMPGLFAAGECTGGVLGTIYVGSGNALANASTYGRIAGRSAAAYALQGQIPAVDWRALEAA